MKIKIGTKHYVTDDLKATEKIDKAANFSVINRDGMFALKNSNNLYINEKFELTQTIENYFYLDYGILTSNTGRPVLRNIILLN